VTGYNARTRRGARRNPFLANKKNNKMGHALFCFLCIRYFSPSTFASCLFLLSFIEEKIMIVTQSYTEEKCTFRRNPCNFFFGTKKNAVSVQLHRKAGTRWTQQATTTTTNILRTESIRARFHN